MSVDGMCRRVVTVKASALVPTTSTCCDVAPVARTLVATNSSSASIAATASVPAS